MAHRVASGILRLGWAVLACLCVERGLASSARAQLCSPDSECLFKKPNVLLVLDYSSSMVGFERAPAFFPEGQTATTRWQASLDSVSYMLHYDDGFFADNLRLALARFAHDPVLSEPATVLVTDTSFPPITDGFALDVPFDGSNGEYLECRSTGVEAELLVLSGTPPPFIDMSLDPKRIMLTWTRGALRQAGALVKQTRENHAGEPGEDKRAYHVLLMTDGDWTCPDQVGQSCDEDPAVAARELRADGIPVHVVAFGDAAMQPSLDEVALQGGTSKAIDAMSPQGLTDALSSVFDQIKKSVIVPECTASLPRMLIVMDGSSSMIDGSAPGETNWDKARYALSGNPEAPNPGDPGYVEPVWSRAIELDGRTLAIEDVVHVGMLAFAGQSEQVEMVELGPCRRDNLAWAMDPRTSCEPPECEDPYAGFPTTWTFKDSDVDRSPPFVSRTRSFMPACNETPGNTSCIGQIPNTFTGQGLEAARELIAEHRREPGAYRADGRTRYFVVLVTDGRTSAGSSDVQSALGELQQDGVDTFVIGFGSEAALDVAQLDQYAAWGNTGAAITVDPTAEGGADALADALEQIVLGIDIDACCVLDDCSEEDEPVLPGAVCGDGLLEGEEVCDDGADNASYGHCGGTCEGVHLRCGDGRIDGPEGCDDGNNDDNDTCPNDCRSVIGDAGERDAGWVPPRIPGDPWMAAGSGGNAGSGSSGQGGSLGPVRDRDAGVTDAAGGGGGDCGCRAAGARREPRAAWSASLLLLAVALRRFRRYV